MPWHVYAGQRHWRVRYLCANAFELALALAAIVAAAAFIVDPTAFAQTAVGRSTQRLGPVWSILYMLGSAGMIAGLVRPSVRAEIVGICLFVPALLTNLTAVLLYTGVQGIAPSMTYLAISVACIVRAGEIIRAYREHGRS